MKHFTIENGMFYLRDPRNAVHARLDRLIMTPIDGAIGFIDMGSRLEDYFHMKISQANALAMLSEVRTLIAAYEKNISLKSVLLRSKNVDGYASDQVEIEMEYEVEGLTGKTVIIPTGGM